MASNRPEKRHATVFPKDLRFLEELGLNIQLARKRRKLTQLQMCERTGLDPKTVRKIEKGEPAVTMGHYIAILAVLGLSGDVAKVAADDELGRKLQDIALLGSRKGS
jgi:transcriptional regulator with XRE-family HTH domain